MEGVYIANVLSDIRDETCAKCKGFDDCNQKCKFMSRVSEIE